MVGQPKQKDGAFLPVVKQRLAPPAPQGVVGGAASVSAHNKSESCISEPPSTANSCSRKGCSKSPRRPQPGNRKLLCHFGGALGELNLIVVREAAEPIRAPYGITVNYDLRPLVGKLATGETASLAALDMEKLRRRGSGLGLDAMEVSGRPEARDCLCSKSGQLKPLESSGFPGAVRISLNPPPAGSSGESCVLLRVVINHPRLDANGRRDPQDAWRAVGSAVLLRCDMPSKADGEPNLLPALGGASPCSGVASFGLMPQEDEPEASAEVERVGPENWGVRLDQLTGFRDEIRADMDRYCSCHRLSLRGGPYGPFRHVCLFDPCPFRLSDMSDLDDHRGIPFVRSSSLTDEAREVCDLSCDMHLVVDRYIKPKTKGTGRGMALCMNAAQPLKISAYVSHVWRQPFVDFVDTLEMALYPDQVAFVASFALDQHASPEKVRLETLSDLWCSQALRSAEAFLLVVDKAMSFTQRAWCMYEVKQAFDSLMPAFIWPHKSVDLVQLKENCARLDFRYLDASYPEHADILCETLEIAGEEINASSRQVIDCLYDRVTAFAASMQQAAACRDFCPKRMRQLLLEWERSVTVTRVAAKQRQYASDLDGMISAMRMEVNSLHADLRARRQSHADAIDAFYAEQRALEEEHLRECERMQDKMQHLDIRQAKEMAELRSELEEAEAVMSQLEQSLKDEEAQEASLQNLYEATREELRQFEDQAKELENSAERSHAQIQEEREKREARILAIQQAQERCSEAEMMQRQLDQALLMEKARLANLRQKEEARAMQKAAARRASKEAAERRKREAEAHSSEGSTMTDDDKLSQYTAKESLMSKKSMMFIGQGISSGSNAMGAAAAAFAGAASGKLKHIVGVGKLFKKLGSAQNQSADTDDERRSLGHSGTMGNTLSIPSADAVASRTETTGSAGSLQEPGEEHASTESADTSFFARRNSGGTSARTMNFTHSFNNDMATKLTGIAGLFRKEEHAKTAGHVECPDASEDQGRSSHGAKSNASASRASEKAHKDDSPSSAKTRLSSMRSVGKASKRRMMKMKANSPQKNSPTAGASKSKASLIEQSDSEEEQQESLMHSSFGSDAVT